MTSAVAEAPKSAPGIDGEGRLHVPRVFYGGAYELMFARELEVCLDGPAGTGKTNAALNKVYLACMKYPGSRWLIARRTNVDLAASALVTFQQQVLIPGDGVTWYGGSKVRPGAFQFPNGSEAVVTGLDKPGKVKSSEYDGAYINEATEIELDHLEMIRGRLRNGRMPYSQIIMDVNPGPPTHWLNLRMEEGRTRRLLSRHIDNPAYYDREREEWTPAGKVYVETVLSGLTGVRYDRLVRGLWVAAEGMVYTNWDRKIHLIKRFHGTNAWGDPPREWARYIVIDWGYTDPACVQWWAVDHDGRAYMFRELYISNLETPLLAERVLAIHKQRNDPLPRDIVADPAGADERAIFSRVTGWGTSKAHKDIKAGIEMVQLRLAVRGDRKPRLFFLEDARVNAEDTNLAARKKPTRSVDEIEGYTWDTGNGRKRGDEPVDRDNHGMDTMRYFVARLDIATRNVSYTRSPYART